MIAIDQEQLATELLPAIKDIQYLGGIGIHAQKHCTYMDACSVKYTKKDQ